MIAAALGGSFGNETLFSDKPLQTALERAGGEPQLFDPHQIAEGGTRRIFRDHLNEDVIGGISRN